MTGLPAAVAGLDLDAVVDALARHGANVTDSAQDLGVPASDLRRLLWANPRLQDQVFEKVEARIDLAEKNIAEALTSEDSRRRDAASFFVVRNSAAARRRGWLTSASAGVEMSVAVNSPTRIIISWEDSPLVKTDDGSVIEHEPLAEP